MTRKSLKKKKPYVDEEEMVTTDRLNEWKEAPGARTACARHATFKLQEPTCGSPMREEKRHMAPGSCMEGCQGARGWGGQLPEVSKLYTSSGERRENRVE